MQYHQTSIRNQKFTKQNNENKLKYKRTESKCIGKQLPFPTLTCALTPCQVNAGNSGYSTLSIVRMERSCWMKQKKGENALFGSVESFEYIGFSRSASNIPRF
jgi:hypothetical protein